MFELNSAFLLQDMEVSYFQTYIDGVDFVFIDTPMFRHLGNDIYGGSRLVYKVFLFCTIISFSCLIYIGKLSK